MYKVYFYKLLKKGGNIQGSGEGGGCLRSMQREGERRQKTHEERALGSEAGS